MCGPLSFLSSAYVALTMYLSADRIPTPLRSPRRISFQDTSLCSFTGLLCRMTTLWTGNSHIFIVTFTADNILSFFSDRSIRILRPPLAPNSCMLVVCSSILSPRHIPLQPVGAAKDTAPGSSRPWPARMGLHCDLSSKQGFCSRKQLYTGTFITQLSVHRCWEQPCYCECTAAAIGTGDRPI